MILHLHTNESLDHIQSEFKGSFPGLKLDFIFRGDEALNLSSRLHHSFSFSTVEELCAEPLKEDILIDDSMTTHEVETIFEKQWHLPASVYVSIDGYWQKNSVTAAKCLHECMHTSLKN